MKEKFDATSHDNDQKLCWNEKCMMLALPGMVQI